MNDASLPALRDPWLVTAFSGWSDAADAATGVVDHLVESWGAEPLLELDVEDYYDFQVHRPVLPAPHEDDRRLRWPTATLFVARPTDVDRDVLLLRAPEPNLRWHTFCAAVLDVATKVGTSGVVSLGALLADVPHSRPVPVSATSSDDVFRSRMELAPSTYSGPVGIGSVILEAARDRGLAALSLWAAVPHYLQDPPCPKASLALLGSLEDALDVPLPQGDLEEMSLAWQRGADEAVQEDPDIADYVSELEGYVGEDDVPEATGDAIAREFQRYLRRRGGRGH